jgi:signal transduction histidine kinase
MQTRVQAVTFDGSVAQVRGGRELKVPIGTRDVEIHFGVAQSRADSSRVRCRLDGFDLEWQDPPSEMRAMVHFVDTQGLDVGGAHKLVSGSSGHWRGTVEESAFTPRVLDAVVPPRAKRAYIDFVSGGAEATLGTYAFRNVSFEIVGLDGESRRASFPLNAGIELSNRLGVPDGWRRHGTKPEMSVVVPTPGAPGSFVLNLMDTDSAAYCAWALAPASWVPVSEGERVRVQWHDCFSIGAAGPAVAKYRFLRPGVYRFQSQAVGHSGEPLGQISELPLVVLAPLWQQPRTWLFGAFGVVGAVALAVRSVTQRRMQRKLSDMDRQRALERERARIAQDIHDDLGSGLAQIAMLSELAQGDAPDNATIHPLLNEISARARAAGRKLDEIVWAINPAHDSAEDLVGYLARFAQDYLTLARIRFRLDVPASLPDIVLTSSQRHQVFLAAKEAIHNAVKHGSATEIGVKVRVEEGSLVITVADDGCGFADTEQTAGSRGSASMRRRLEKLGGRFGRESRVGVGTAVTFTLPLNLTTT